MGKGKKGQRRPPRLDDPAPVAAAAGDQEFLEAMAGITGVIPDKDAAGTVAETAARAAEARRGAAKDKVDLHGCTVEEAKRRIDVWFAGWTRGDGAAEFTLQVVTGKGQRSGPAGGVLAREMHAYVSAKYGRYIVSIESSPADVAINGLPVRGHFHVQLRRQG